jgi:hypothetical protein
MNQLNRVGKILYFLSCIMTMGIGVYFVFFRPALLPEDIHFINVSPSLFESTGLLTWLGKVFIVMGGFIFSTGLLKIAMLRAYESKRLVLASVWLTSIALMSGVNFLIQSDFRWPLFALALLELLGVLLMGPRSRDTQSYLRAS